MNKQHPLTDAHLNAGKMLTDLIGGDNNIEPIQLEDGMEYLSLSAVSNIISMCQAHWMKDHDHIVKQVRAECQAQHRQAMADQLTPVIRSQLAKVNQIRAEISDESYNALVAIIQSMSALPQCELCGQHGHMTSYCWFNGQLYNLCSKDKLAKPAYDTFRSYVSFVEK